MCLLVTLYWIQKHEHVPWNGRKGKQSGFLSRWSLYALFPRYQIHLRLPGVMAKLVALPLAKSKSCFALKIDQHLCKLPEEVLTQS